MSQPKRGTFPSVVFSIITVPILCCASARAELVSKAEESQRSLIIWIALVLAGLVVAFLVWWLVPPYVVNRFAITDNKDKAEVTDNYRKTIGQALAAIVLIATFAWTFYKDRETIDLSRAQFKAQTDQFLEQQQQARDQFVNQQFIAPSCLLKKPSLTTPS